MIQTFIILPVTCDLRWLTVPDLRAVYSGRRFLFELVVPPDPKHGVTFEAFFFGTMPDSGNPTR